MESLSLGTGCRLPVPRLAIIPTVTLEKSVEEFEMVSVDFFSCFAHA
jgi:hypothetical protein